ncbi:hypothetical protein GC102_01895 [Paenibacillus sp. LMG 31460]|uniref:Copper amine oxidase-like N-terminal domain-containing protein n=1 Tax=Paenibacillus germinis TaxID=2654979 RepID=A0ABX1YUA4_9BACL|nr:copper amine oxidase N-terminal domain-containing protein [Paenibacillus germinis]NOU84532.1 hypothetical protein [Paenibacillus germinis]
MRWIPFIVSLPIIFLLGADSPSETRNPDIELLQFRSQITSIIEPINASLQGADQFEVAWRLQDSSPQKLFIANDSTAYYQSDGQWKSVLPSGERLPVKQSAKLPEAVKPLISLNLKATERSLTLIEDQKALWTYSLPETNQIRPSTLQYDAAEHIYFQDNNGSWYSLDRNGKERYKLLLQAQDTQLTCKAAPSGDAFCTSPSLGILAVREKINAPRLIIDGKERFFPQRPEIINDRTFVPLRSIFEAMNAKVVWNQETQTVTAVKGNRTIGLTLDSEKALLNGKKIQLDAPPILYQGSTYVPLRFVGEALGATVIWEDATRTIQIIN